MKVIEGLGFFKTNEELGLVRFGVRGFKFDFFLAHLVNCNWEFDFIA